MIDLIDLAPSFSFLNDKGLSPSGSDYRSDEFGNAALTMIGAPFSLRFARDRGQVFIDVGSSAAGWYKLEYVLEFVDHSVAQQHLGEPPNVELLGELLRLNWNEVVNVFSDDRKRSRLQEFVKEKSGALFARLFRKPPA